MKRTGENPVSPNQLRISLTSPIQDGEIWPNLCNGGLLKSTYGTKITGNPSKIFSLGFPKSPGFIRTHLAREGIPASDDVNWNSTFYDFCKAVNARRVVIRWRLGLAAPKNI